MQKEGMWGGGGALWNGEHKVWEMAVVRLTDGGRGKERQRNRETGVLCHMAHEGEGRGMGSKGGEERVLYENGGDVGRERECKGEGGTCRELKVKRNGERKRGAESTVGE